MDMLFNACLNFVLMPHIRLLLYIQVIIGCSLYYVDSSSTDEIDRWSCAFSTDKGVMRCFSAVLLNVNPCSDDSCSCKQISNRPILLDEKELPFPLEPGSISVLKVFISISSVSTRFCCNWTLAILCSRY